MNATTTPSAVIPDLKTGLRLVSSLPLGVPERAQDDLNRILDSLAQTPPAADVYLELLEQSRSALCFVAEELAHSYANKRFPLNDNEERNFRRVADTWRKVAQAYDQCTLLEISAQGMANHSRIAVSLQRSIAYASLCLIEHYRARREPPSGIWQEIHASYAMADACGVDTTPVVDALDPRERTVHCTSALISALLTELAGPYGLSTRDFGLVRRWADRWAPMVSLHPARQDEEMPPLIIDLTQDTALRSGTEESSLSSLRCLDISHLSLQLRELVHQLARKATPSDIGLGEDCTAGQCRRLLDHLSTAWSPQAHAPRKYRRHAAKGFATVCAGFDAMHFFISGKDFSPPDKLAAQTHLEFERLFAFPQMVEPEHALQFRQEQLGLTCELWEVINQSANGFRMRRSQSGTRIAHGQLMAVRPQAEAPFLLGRINWLRQTGDGELTVGVEALPGVPEAIAARPLTHTNVHNAAFERAFLLPAIPALGTEASLLLPSGWYRPFRVVEIAASAPRRVELLHVLNDGPDFEHVSLAAVK